MSQIIEKARLEYKNQQIEEAKEYFTGRDLEMILEKIESHPYFIGFEFSDGMQYQRVSSLDEADEIIEIEKSEAAESGIEKIHVFNGYVHGIYGWDAATHLDTIKSVELNHP